MDTVRLSRLLSQSGACLRQPDDHASGPALGSVEYQELAAVISGGRGSLDPACLIQTGPADRPLPMPVQELRPDWFQSLLELVGLASWHHPSDHGMIRGDA